jgi:hypothetical protein
MEILVFVLILLFLGPLALTLGVDSRPSECEHTHNW